MVGLVRHRIERKLQKREQKRLQLSLVFHRPRQLQEDLKWDLTYRHAS